MFLTGLAYVSSSLLSRWEVSLFDFEVPFSRSIWLVLIVRAGKKTLYWYTRFPYPVKPPILLAPYVWKQKVEQSDSITSRFEDWDRMTHIGEKKVQINCAKRQMPLIPDHIRRNCWKKEHTLNQKILTREHSINTLYVFAAVLQNNYIFSVEISRSKP